VGVLAPTLGRHRGDGALQDLQQRLLDALAGDVPGDRGVVGLAGDLVDLVDVDDARLGLLDVEVRGLDQLEQDVLDVLPDVARLGERRGVRDREGDVEQLREGLGQQRLAGAGGPSSRMLDFCSSTSSALAGAGGADLDALVVVVDRDREGLLRLLLTDHVLVEVAVDLLGLRQLVELRSAGSASSSSMISLHRSMHSSQM
jgi:hypothetical protein